MAFRKHKTLLFALLCLVAFPVFNSCDDDEEDTVYYYLDGALRFKSTAYIPQSEGTYRMPDIEETDDYYEFVPTGVTHPLEDGTVGYYFKVTPGMSTSDTTRWLDGRYHYDERGAFRFHFGDSLGTYKVYAYSFGSSSYSGSSYTTYVTVVKPGLDGSIKTTCAEDQEYYTDPRDGNKYVVVKVGETSWLKPNLAYAGTDEEPLGVGYRGYDIMSGVFGRYYSWDDAQKACPEGWSLPSDSDWAAAAATVSDGNGIVAGYPWENVAGGFIDRSVIFNDDEELIFWDYWPKVKADNSTGLSILSTGYGSRSSLLFDGVYDIAAQWTSDDAAEGTKGVYRYIRDSYPDIYIGQADKTDFLANVRCVKK